MDNKTETQMNTQSAATPNLTVPTPNVEKGKLDTSIVEKVVGQLTCDLIVIRSTVNPGTTDQLIKETGKHIVFQPEYLGETPAHPLLDTTHTNFVILGGSKENTNKVIELYATTYNANTKIRQVSLLEAEVRPLRT